MLAGAGSTSCPSASPHTRWPPSSAWSFRHRSSSGFGPRWRGRARGSRKSSPTSRSRSAASSRFMDDALVRAVPLLRAAASRSRSSSYTPPRSSPRMKNGAAALQHVQQRVAAAGGQHIADLISWNTDRIHVARVDARRVFDLIGLGGLIPDVDPATMLSRAAGEVRRPDGIVVRPFAQPNKDTPAAVGVYLVKARAGEAGDEYIYGARARVNLKTGLVVALPPE